MAMIREESAVELQELVLVPHFVVKTKMFSPYKTYPSGTKLFINVCTNDKVPVKEILGPNGVLMEKFEPQVIFEAISRGKWEIPILTSPELRSTLDKKKNKCILADCVINDKYMKWCMMNEDLKDIMIQWCIDAVEFHVGDNFVVDRDTISFPKRTCMGESPPNIQVDLKHLQNISKELEEMSKDMYEEKDSPSAILEAKRYEKLMAEGDGDSGVGSDAELPPLIPHQAKGKLIVEMEDELPASEMIEEVKSAKEDFGLSAIKSTKVKSDNSISRTKIHFEVQINKLEPHTTQLNHKYELVVKSKLEKASDYQLKYYDTKKELLISSSEDSNSSITFPLPLDVNGSDISSFYVRKDGALHIFIS